jgi:hypothetical protein
MTGVQGAETPAKLGGRNFRIIVRTMNGRAEVSCRPSW